jgi:O-succinylbenzoic acid--CoA ligase
MDTTLLGNPAFWSDPQPTVAGGMMDRFPLPPELAGHVLFQTSGSSGTPKWVALSKEALLLSAAAVNEHLEIDSESVWGLALPLNHVGGFGVLARAYEAACGLEIFRQRWDPERFRSWLGRTGVTHVSLVPTQVHDLVKARLTAPATLSAAVVGGGCLDIPTGRTARSLGWPVLASFGMTEAGSQIATQGLDLLHRPYQNAPLSLLPIWQAEVRPGGLLAISGPALFSGYLTEGCFTPLQDRWHVTRDRVSLEPGKIIPLGRADHLVKVLGELVDPESIERELVELSQGRLSPSTVVVIAVPDERAGNLLVPLFESGAERSVISTTLAAYASNAPGFRRLQPEILVPRFPRSELGKIRRASLLTLYPSPHDSTNRSGQQPL